MIAPGRSKGLLEEAQRLAEALGRFQTPGTGDPVDPSRLAELSRFLQVSKDIALLGAFMEKLPTSYQARMSRSALPQIQEINRLVRPLLARARDAEELLFVLGWAQRLLSTAERGTGWGGAPSRAEGARRQGGGGRR